MIRVREISQHTIDVQTRMPFRYGIATLTALPHLFVRAVVEIDAHRQVGISAENLPPKWFTKNPDTPVEQDLADLRRMIDAACSIALHLPPARTLFEFWQHLYAEVHAAAANYADPRRFPPLVAGLAITLLERAVIDAFCTAKRITFGQALRDNAFGIELGECHPTLRGRLVSEFLPAEPVRSIVVRHTVGLGDPLTDAEIPPALKIDDGLPQSLEANIREYGLTHFKIKLAGTVEADCDRVKGVLRLLGDNPRVQFTLDGNENYLDVGEVRRLWEQLERPGIAKQMIAIEQPLHRDVALTPESAKALLAWVDRPPIIIDESDDSIDASARALAMGYQGTTYKSCKGVIKGVVTAALMRASGALLTAEDLSTIGPVSLLQDLAVVAALGLTHAERNGHQYFHGLAAFSEWVGKKMLGCHSDLYRIGPPVSLRISNGVLSTATVNLAPFGVGFDFDPWFLRADIVPNAT